MQSLLRSLERCFSWSIAPAVSKGAPEVSPQFPQVPQHSLSLLPSRAGRAVTLSGDGCCGDEPACPRLPRAGGRRCQPCPRRTSAAPRSPSCLSDRECLSHRWTLVKVNREGKIHLSQGHPCWDSIPRAAVPGSCSSTCGMLPSRFGSCRGVLSTPTPLDGSKH